QVEIGEDDREVLMITLSILVRDGPPVQSDFTQLRTVEPGEDLDEGRLTTAVAADEEDELASTQREIDRTQLERPSLDVGWIAEGRAVEVDLLPCLPELPFAFRHRLDAAGDQRDAKVLHLLERDAGTGEDRPGLEQTPHRPHQIQRGQHIPGDALS